MSDQIMSNFHKAHLYGIDSNGYTFFQIARTITSRKKSIEINEIPNDSMEEELNNGKKPVCYIRLGIL